MHRHEPHSANLRLLLLLSSQKTDAPLQIAGYCTYLGTTELGMVYQFGLYSGDQLREGAFALDLYNTDYGEMTITPISGVNLFDAPEGGCTVFTRL